MLSLYRDYRRVEGYPDYVVSNYGEVFSLQRKRVLKTIQLKACPDDRGYPQIELCNGKSKTTKVHVLVGKAFIGERTGNLTYDHIDRNTLNNRADNLRLATLKQQMDNKGDYKNNKLGEKHITEIKVGKYIHYRIQIQRTINGKKKNILNRSFSSRKYKLEDVIKIRDEFLSIKNAI